MKILLQLEEGTMTLAALFLLSLTPVHLPVWAWALLFFAPDLSMLGYLGGNRIGAIAYNLVHHKGLAAAVGLMGYFQSDAVLAAGLLLFAHASFDRMLGYGLKTAEGFSFTHLGRIGKAANARRIASGSGSGLPA